MADCNRGYAYTTIISSRYHGQNVLSHLASLYPHSTAEAWQEKLDSGEVTLNGGIATGREVLASGQTLVWNRPPWIEPDAPQHFEVLFEDAHMLAVNKPSGLPTLPRWRLHGQHAAAPGTEADARRRPCPPIGPSDDRHRAVCEDAAGGSATDCELEHAAHSENLQSAGPGRSRAGLVRNSDAYRPCAAPASWFGVGCEC